MIQRAFIVEWRNRAPWATDEQVEQDLLLSRALTEIYLDKELRDKLVFRGGTALHKLFLGSPTRYSEDIDLVQAEAGPIGPIMDALHKRLDPWLGYPRWKQSRGMVTFYYRFSTEVEPVQQRRLKVEINTREHFSVLGLEHHPFEVRSRWWQGQSDVLTYPLEELLGTKLRALYQRKKGRDLFDLWSAHSQAEVDPVAVVECFQQYLLREGLSVTRARFEANLQEKLQDPTFCRDIEPLLATGTHWDLPTAANYVLSSLAPLLSA
jgi:predicted nucleotidyltransferase component of viral defense system